MSPEETVEMFIGAIVVMVALCIVVTEVMYAWQRHRDAKRYARYMAEEPARRQKWWEEFEEEQRQIMIKLGIPEERRNQMLAEMSTWRT